MYLLVYAERVQFAITGLIIVYTHMIKAQPTVVTYMYKSIEQ